MNHPHIITFITFLPLVGGLLLFDAGEIASPQIARGAAMLFSLAGLVIAAVLWTRFDPTSTGLQFVERHSWIPSIGVQYFVGIDGLSLLMVVLTAIVTPMAILASRIDDRPNVYFSMVLFLQSGLFGTFTALNFFHWFLFWELSLIPAFFLIKLWGGPERNAAATQFFIYTMVGSITLLLSFLALYRVAGTFDFLELAVKGRTRGTRRQHERQTWLVFPVAPSNCRS